VNTAVCARFAEYAEYYKNNKIIIYYWRCSFENTGENSEKG
jgi:hypothetical protein